MDKNLSKELIPYETPQVEVIQLGMSSLLMQSIVLQDVEEFELDW